MLAGKLPSEAVSRLGELRHYNLKPARTGNNSKWRDQISESPFTSAFPAFAELSAKSCMYILMALRHLKFF